MAERLVVNEKIKDKSMLLIDFDGKKIGIVKKEEALRRAKEANSDLVAVSSGDEKKICVCKILDYNKMRYEESKKKKNKKSNFSVKEMRVSYDISDHDLETKHKHILNYSSL